jgi:O-antigen/teichoic acid export membrane protein
MVPKLLNKRSVRQAGSVTSAYTVSQAINSAGAFVRVPLLVGAIGINDYGVLLAILSFWPWLAIMSEAARQTMRVWVAESGPTDTCAPVPIPVRRRLIAASCAVVIAGALVALLIPLGKLVEPNSGSEDNARLALFGVGLVGALSVLPAARTGWLEARGKLVLTSLLSGASTILGLPCLFVALHFSNHLLLISAVSVLAFAMPVMCSLFFGLNHGENVDGFEANTDTFTPTLRHMFLWSLAALAAYGFDTIIVGALVGAAAAAEYGIALRILGLATIVPLALGPTVMVRFAATRRKDETVTPLAVCKVSGLFVSATFPLALLMGAGGPTLAGWLTHGQVPGRQSLYWLLAVSALLGAASGPIYAAFTAQRGLPARNAVMIVGSLINVGASCLLALRIGTIGPALASVAVASVQFALLNFLMFRRPSLIGA